MEEMRRLGRADIESSQVSNIRRPSYLRESYMGSNGEQNRTVSPWNPEMFVRFEKGLDTSMGTARIITDAGPAYIKAMGNRQGPHPLACEIVGTRLAAWFELPTFDHFIIEIDAEVDEIPFLYGGDAADAAESGPAFVTRAVSGHTWGGAEEGLETLVNPEDVGRLVVFDTWILNRDRHPPESMDRDPNYDNVFLEDLVGDDAGKTRLIAMDHTHCFTIAGNLNEKVSNIERVKDDRLYGLFPGFRSRVLQRDVESAIERLREVRMEIVQPIVEEIPNAWDVNPRTKEALADLIVQRANFVAGSILDTIARECWPNQLFDNR
jgi:hypothetical protein